MNARPDPGDLPQDLTPGSPKGVAFPTPNLRIKTFAEMPLGKVIEIIETSGLTFF